MKIIKGLVCLAVAGIVTAAESAWSQGTAFTYQGQLFSGAGLANGGKILSKPGEVPIKYRAPDGTVAEIVPKGRYENMREEQR